MDQPLLLKASVLAAIAGVALFLLLRPGSKALRGIGALLGLAVVGGLFGLAAITLSQATGAIPVAGLELGSNPGAGGRPDIFFFIFSLIAIASAVRMITHHRPIYSALYFVMVVLASAALFLLLEAEFMAFALVIVYAGAILITYLFVIMLAQQSPSPGQDETTGAEYDRVPREPAAAAVVGFVMLALLTDMMIRGSGQLSPTDEYPAARAAWNELEQMPGRFESVVLKQHPDFAWPPDQHADDHLIHLEADGRAYVTGHLTGSSSVQSFYLDETALPENVQRVGWALVWKFPVSLEVAGIILLLAMFGAVVLARRQIELGEDEFRQATGLHRLPTDAHSDSLSEGGAS